MEHDVLLNKISCLSQCISRIREKRPQHADILSKDLDLQDIISVNLERAVQICVDIASHITADVSVRPPAVMAESFAHLSDMGVIPLELSFRMRKAVGFRNIAVHQYQPLDWDVVFLLVTPHGASPWLLLSLLSILFLASTTVPTNHFHKRKFRCVPAYSILHF